MFYEGDLQSGIGLAVQESKAVLCFITNASDDMTEKWMEGCFKDPEVVELLAAYAVALKFEKGSQEANYLSALCPVEETPLVLIIKNGRVQDVITNVNDSGSVKTRIQSALAPPKPEATVASPPPTQEQTSSRTQQTTPAPPPPQAFVSSPPVSEPVTTPTPVSSQNVSRSRPSASDPSAPSPPVETTPSSSAVDKQRNEYIVQQRQREAAQRAERQRIKEAIEADRRERKRQAELAKRGGDSNTSETGTPQPPSTEVRLAVRLLDGSSIRSTFPRSATLSSTIRPWVSNHLSESSSANANTPYTFKLVLAPKPNRPISISEEEMRLEELLSDEEFGRGKVGVTFVLVPEKAFTEAYAGNAGGGVLSLPIKAAGAGYGLASSIAGGVYGGLKTFLGIGIPPANSASGSSSSASTENSQSGPGGNIKVRTLADQRVEDQRRRQAGNQQLYNGNQTNFMPRNDSNDKDDKATSQKND